MRFFPLFFRLVHRNCLIFGPKVNLGITYTLAILEFFGKFLISLNPLKATGGGSGVKKQVKLI